MNDGEALFYSRGRELEFRYRNRDCGRGIVRDNPMSKCMLANVRVYCRRSFLRVKIDEMGGATERILIFRICLWL